MVAMDIEGIVQETTSRWVDSDRIVTEATIDTPDGPVVVSQLGGTADGLTMRVFDGVEPLVQGMRVAVAAHRDVDLSNQEHVLVDHVKVVAYPEGFVRSGPTTAGHYLYWESGCVFGTPDAHGTEELAGDTEFKVIDGAIATWNTALAGCSYQNIVQQAREAREVGNDHVNLIKFRDTSWCRPATKNDAMRCYSPSAAGLTTAVFVDDPGSARDGAIVDADIEINGVSFAISHAGITLGTASCDADLSNTLTHELGHLLGLDHNCVAQGDPPRVDGNGNPSPLCSTVSDPAIIDATMYYLQTCGETKKASLEADDILGVCTIYPERDDPGTCAPVPNDSGCCSATGQPVPTAVLGLATLALLRRRRRG
jgi:uncharacterized protein (TIGR03382 family)